MKLFNIYTKSFYGSNLYDLFSNECNRLYTSWNIAVRDCFQVSRLTHRYLIEQISQSMHPQVALCSRFINYDKSLLTSSKSSIRLLAQIKRNDKRTVHGRNLARIAAKCNSKNINDISSSSDKADMKYVTIPEDDAWRVDVISDMLAIKTEIYHLDNFEQNDIDNILLIACTS